MNKISLHSFCKTHKLPKSTVYGRCKALSIDTKAGLSPDAVVTLKREFNIDSAIGDCQSQSQKLHKSSGEMPLSPTKILDGEASEGLTLHIGCLPSLPSVASPIPVGNDAAYLTMQQQRLAVFEAQQRQALEHMQQQFQRTQALNAQYREAMSLSDQLLLHEWQLRGVQLGYSALQTKHEAFKATVQAAEAGTLPGKPQPGEEPPVQSA